MLLCHTYVSFMYDTFVVMVTRLMNKDIWDILKRVLEYELTITTEYVLDPDLYTNTCVLMFNVVCSIKIAAF